MPLPVEATPPAQDSGVPKKDQWDTSSNYRPVSLMLILSKIMEWAIWESVNK
ncbi:hypothetical protein UY3_04818 [Chelonia mydas]|uniref:Uncharacterized protein n=1 Tax=Chelonia mydas TaxID=8469 RepID=M7BLF7_CHEMY|nr:hypothetical protein UY3_04818 [Chelonia mydas]